MHIQVEGGALGPMDLSVGGAIAPIGVAGVEHLDQWVVGGEAPGPMAVAMGGASEPRVCL